MDHTKRNAEDGRNVSIRHEHFSALDEFACIIRTKTNVHTCSITSVDLEKKRIAQLAFSSSDPNFEKYLQKRREVPVSDKALGTRDGRPGVDFEVASRGAEFECMDLQVDGCKVANPDVAKEFGLSAVYCFPIKDNGFLRGYINLFSAERQPFSADQKSVCQLDAPFAEILVRQYQSQKKYNQILVEAIEEMANVGGENRRDQILSITHKFARQLMGKGEYHSAVLKLDDKTGELREVEAIPQTDVKSIVLGQGYCSKALESGDTIRAYDTSPEWEETYVDAWGAGSRAELVVPLLVRNEQVRVGTATDTAFRPLGALNFESTSVDSFHGEDEDALLPLVSQAALLIEKLEVERKLATLRETEKSLPGRGWEDALQLVAEGTRSALGFEVVNISLVDFQKNTIGTEVIAGLKNEVEVAKFKSMASHELGGKDIQAHIVKNKQPEVPEADDPRFDQNIWTEFGHENLIRVFVPVVAPTTNKCIGTIDAGYKRGLKKHIYESDVQILQLFSELVVEAIEKRKSVLLDKITHELRSPVSGILGHTDRLKRHHRNWESRRVDTKLDDIELDCEILLQNVEELEYFLGRPPRKVEIEEVMVMRDVVIKTLNQLKPLISSFDLRITQDFYRDEDVRKVEIYTDKKKLNQVAYNLLVNSIRYAKDDPKKFQLLVLADEESDPEHYLIKFRDWGIGINEQYRETIFNEYFRSPEAIAKYTNGTGLGLAIARKIMRRDISGDLVLVNLSEPTEFHLKIPKRFKRSPKEWKKSL